MAKLTVEVPDELMNQVRLSGYSAESVLIKALVKYLEDSLPARDITKTKTWELCGKFSVSESVEKETPSEDTPAEIVIDEETNYAEQVDDILYRGF